MEKPLYPLFAPNEGGNPDSSSSNELEELKRQVAHLQSQLAYYQQGEGLYPDLYQHSPVMMLAVAVEDGKLLAWNQAFRKALGFTEAQLNDRQISDILTPEASGTWKAAIEHLQSGEAIHQLPLQVLAQNKMRLLLRASANVKLDEAGNRQAYRLIFQTDTTAFSGSQAEQFGGFPGALTGEITSLQDEGMRLEELRAALLNVMEDLREEQANLAKADELAAKLKRSNEDLEQFAYLISHDLQEPLRMVTNYLQLIERRAKDRLKNDELEFLHFAVDGAKRMRGLLDGILAYSRVKSRAKPFVDTDLNQTFHHVKMNLKQRIQESQAVLSVPSFPTVQADPSQMVQVFQNLLSNALKFTREGEAPAISWQVERQEQFFQFSIQDQGIGFDDQYQDRIFAMFQRLNHREEYEGNGIGLAICRNIIQRHGGEIWAESEPGQGATFYFTLPIERLEGGEA
ncbi:MAG: ATP-binding protein [Bacteroidota bacterium]